LSRSAIRSERVLSSRRIYSGGLINLRLDEVELTSGGLLTREIIEHPGAVVVLPLVRPDRLVFVRQYREAAGRALVELPAGTLRGGREAHRLRSPGVM
jgi:ADP-ribose pyrophosphatase